MAQTAAVYQQWFQLADEDRDGAIAGAEAVKFFQRSGLDQATLGQIWELSSGGGAKLNPAQFTSAMRLVALAQGTGGRLAPEQARVVVAGMGPALGVPRMQGLEQYATAAPGSAPGYMPQATGAAGAGPGAFAAAGYTPQYTGARPPAAAGPTGAGYAPQYTGMPTGAPVAGYTPQGTGMPPGAPAGYAPQATGAAAGGLPPCTPADMQRYQAAFAQLDADKDGIVQGGDCFGYFMQWGLDKSVLKHIWDIVAGPASALNQQQLVSCLYLMDAAKRGIRPPTALPPGPFPPVAQQWSLASQFGGASAAAAGPAVSQQAMVMPGMPALPTKFNDGQDAAGGDMAQRASQVPQFNNVLGNMNQEQRDRLVTQVREAGDKEGKLFTVEDKAAQVKAQLAAFNAAMQEITVFKSRTDVAMLEAQDQVARLQEELVVARSKYDKAYSAAQTQGEAAKKLREHLGTLMADKTEAEGRLLQLEAEIAAANAVTPADVARMEAEVQALHQRIASQEAVRDSKSTALAAVRHQKVALEAKLAEVEAARASADQEVKDAQKQVSELQAAIAAARNAGNATSLAGQLSKAAELYRNLYASVMRTGANVPFECLPANLNLASWMDDALAGAADWNDLDDNARGYILVNALPGQRLDINKGKAAPATAGALPADAFGEVPAFGTRPATPTPTPVDATAPASPAVATAAAADGPQPMDIATAADAAAPVDTSGAVTPAPSADIQKSASTASMSGAPAPATSVPAPGPTQAATTAPAAGDFGFDDNAF